MEIFIILNTPYIMTGTNVEEIMIMPNLMKPNTDFVLNGSINNGIFDCCTCIY